MNVPDELVEAALKSFGEGWGLKVPENPNSEARQRMRAALQAVLPKVRERLVSEMDWSSGRTAFEAAFDHAFPEEDLSLANPDPLSTPSKDENAA